MIISFMGIAIIAAFTFESLPKALDDLFLCEHFDAFAVELSITVVILSHSE